MPIPSSSDSVDLEDVFHDRVQPKTSYQGRPIQLYFSWSLSTFKDHLLRRVQIGTEAKHA
ncbi:hypothetical protein WG66_006645 [Moniliophthora roreri]|nr:hypothetical protein WG66_006645 [Moniliophthora roreri]